MADPVISPDGKMYWDGEQWIPIQNSNQIQTGNIHDSVVQVNNDSEVVRAANTLMVLQKSSISKPHSKTISQF